MSLNLLTMNWTTRIIAVSEDVAASIKKHKRKLSPQLSVILNGVNVRHFAHDKFDKSQIRNAFKIPYTAPVVGTIAVFRFQKRLDVWMEIAAKILHSFPETHFILVGDGPLKPMLLQKRKDLGLEDRIHFAGLQTEVRPYIAAFDLYMMSSVFEGLPIALLENMASGCPVISTDAGGVKEVIRNEVDGLLCPVDNPIMLADLAIRLLQSEDMRSLFGLAARKRIEASFNMEIMVKQLENLYTKLPTGKAIA